LEEIDRYAKEHGWNRSEFLAKAALDYIETH